MKLYVASNLNLTNLSTTLYISAVVICLFIDLNVLFDPDSTPKPK